MIRTTCQPSPATVRGNDRRGCFPPQAEEAWNVTRSRCLSRAHILTIGEIMIRRFIGIAVVAASVALPFAAHAQGVPGGVAARLPRGRTGGGSGRRDRRGCHRWCRRRRERRPGRRRASRVFAATSSNSGAPLISIAKICGSAPSCRKKASPTTTSRKNMAFATTATRWSTAARFWSNRAAEGSSKSSNKNLCRADQGPPHKVALFP